MYKGLVFYMCTGRDFMETTNIYFDKIQSYLGLVKEKTKFT